MEQDKKQKPKQLARKKRPSTTEVAEAIAAIITAAGTIYTLAKKLRKDYDKRKKKQSTIKTRLQKKNSQ